MAANKFATILHRNTNRVGVVLVYAALEWFLIALLLLNSLFSYLILRFADYFGLQRPCPSCSRLDHLFGLRLPDLLCPRHTAEVSRLGYCSTHRRLAEASDFCEDCLSSPSPAKDGCGNGELNSSVKCSCCGLALERKLLCCSPQERDAVATDRGRSDVRLRDHPGDDQGDEEFGEFKAAEPCIAEKAIAEEDDEKVVLIMEKKEVDDYISSDFRNDSRNSDDCRKGESVDVSSDRHLDFFIGGDDCELIPVEWTDSVVVTSYPRLCPIMEEDQDNCGGYEDLIIDFCLPSASKPDLVMEGFSSGNDSGVLVAVEQVGILQNASEDSPGTSFEEGDGQLAAPRNVDATEESLQAHGERGSPDDDQGEEECASQKDEVGAEVSIGTEVPAPEAANVDEIHDVEAVSSDPCKEEFDAGVICDQEAINEIRDEEAISWDPCIYEVDAEVSIGTEICEQEAVNVDEMRDEEAVSWDPCKDEVDAEVSVGTEICDQEAINIDEIRDEDVISWDPCKEGDHNTPHTLDYDNHDADIDQSEWETLEFRTNSIEMGNEALDHQLDHASEGGEDSSTSRDFLQITDFDSHAADSARHEEESFECRTISIEMRTDASSHHSDAELNENEDERIPDTPTSIDSLHQLHRRLLLLEKRDSGSTEESLDGSVMSEIEGDEGTVTVEKLKLALRAERRTLHSLYTELEEERSASAVAASQTMAMINRLQEEKAAMQMEALQYQRMMEEQSEYDQEALQLLNDLMVKREREKEEVERELEVYRRKVEEYEGKEKRKAMMVVPRDSKDSSDCCSNEESDGLSIDLNEEARKGGDAINGHGNTPCDAVLYLEESLANFEEERALILKQLKSLEDNILNVNGEQEEEQWHYKENGNGHAEISDLNGEVDCSENGHCNMNDNKHNYRPGRFAGPKAKRLLPLFDAIGEEMDEDWSQKTPADQFEAEDAKTAIMEEEVDHIYERLQVLEADREFLKHCIGSLRKGDKGLELLGEILQHLRDLRCTELHGRDVIIGDAIMQY